MTNIPHRTQNALLHPEDEHQAPTPQDMRQREIRSFVRRQGKITAGQRRALQTLSARWVVPFSGAPLQFEAIFANTNPVTLEIGFGMGESTAAIAQARPDMNFLGVEVYDAGVGALMQRAETQGLNNIRIIQDDAVALVRQGLTTGCLAGAHVFFPDPWPKKRHHKRRLLKAEFVSMLASRLKPGAALHIATDWPDYAQEILEVLSHEPLLVNAAPDQTGYCPRPDSRPLTKFEQRGLRLGNPVADLIFLRKTGT
ncbi:MAG: tRNA (guanosine(46)-N7)-methyltransferase TrmB [Burkholderiaceae bacterium]